MSIRLISLVALTLLGLSASVSRHSQVFVASHARAASRAAQIIAEVTVTGTPIKVFDHAQDQQESDNVPDAEVTAWREADGTVNLMIPDGEAYRMRGPDLKHLIIDRHRIFSSTRSAGQLEEEFHDFSHWFMGPYSLDGRRFYTLSHSEWYACLPAGDCGRATANGNPAQVNSWANSVNSFVSFDGGASWRLNVVRGNHVVANTAHRWIGSTAMAQKIYLKAFNQSGMFQPSRVIREGGFFYSVAFHIHRDFSQVDAAAGRYEAPIDRAGYVLLRTADITDPNGWQAWTGEDRFGPLSGERFKVFQPRRHGATLNATPAQIIYDTNAQRYLLIHTLFGGSNAVYYVTTASLARPDWSDATPIIGSDRLLIDPSGLRCGLNDANYPSIIDEQSSGFNFEFTSGKPLLFFSTAPGRFGGNDLARDVYEVQLSITYR